MDITAVSKAYAARDDAALLKALNEFKHRLTHCVWSLGPAAASLELQKNEHLLAILNKTAAEAEEKSGGPLALVVGHLAAYIHYIDLIADRERVDAIVVRVLELRDQGEQASLARIMILKIVFSQCGERSKKLVEVVARLTTLKQSLVRRHVRDLLEMGLIRQIEVYKTLRALKAHREAIHYSITQLGEAVLMRLEHPYELALFYVSLAAYEPKLRAAMRDEIKRTWPADE